MCCCRYSPDAFDYLPSDKDMVLMNFYSRSPPINDILGTNATTPEQPTADCCMRFNKLTCQPAAPAVGLVTCGGMLINARRFAEEKRGFKQYEGKATSLSCDGALADDLFQDGWSYATHPVNVCALHHNSNPKSCSIVGGVYYDSNVLEKAGCHEMGALPLALEDINYHAFVQSENACVCPKQSPVHASAGSEA